MRRAVPKSTRASLPESSARDMSISCRKHEAFHAYRRRCNWARPGGSVGTPHRARSARSSPCKTRRVSPGGRNGHNRALDLTKSSPRRGHSQSWGCRATPFSSICAARRNRELKPPPAFGQRHRFVRGVILSGRASINNAFPARLHKFRRRPSVLPSRVLASLR
jgi:hypothetical protein